MAVSDQWGLKDEPRDLNTSNEVPGTMIRSNKMGTPNWKDSGRPRDAESETLRVVTRKT